jgi:hypothetical protein
MTMWKSRSLFSFLMRIVILNKNFLKKQTCITYFYFPINPHNIQTGTANVSRRALSCEACFKAESQLFKNLPLNNVKLNCRRKRTKISGGFSLPLWQSPCDSYCTHGHNWRYSLCITQKEKCLSNSA